MKTDTNSWNGSNNIKSVLSFIQLCFQQSQMDILVHFDVCFTVTFALAFLFSYFGHISIQKKDQVAC